MRELIIILAGTVVGTLVMGFITNIIIAMSSDPYFIKERCEIVKNFFSKN